MENVREPMKAIRGAYACLGAEDRLCHHICPGGHQWHPEGADLFAAVLGRTALYRLGSGSRKEGLNPDSNVCSLPALQRDGRYAIL